MYHFSLPSILKGRQATVVVEPFMVKVSCLTLVLVRSREVIALQSVEHHLALTRSLGDGGSRSVSV